MGENNANEEITETESPPEPPPLSGYQQHIGQMCSLQLREGVQYIIITSSNQMVRGDSGTAVMPLIQGQLVDVSVEPSGDVILAVKTASPDGSGGLGEGTPNGVLTILLHSVDVAFATFPERNLVQAV